MEPQRSPRVCGVPEHFNRAWRTLAANQQAHWQEVPEGTGRMLQLLDSGDCDVALLLTEGAVAGAARGVDLQIVGVWVDSPLHWGVHVPAASSFHGPEDIVGRRVAISRYGSGSHLMAGVYARKHAWPQPVDYVVVDTLQGARDAFHDGRADVFLWERATTAPLVEAGEFRRVDVLPTPWPCFVACCRRDASDTAKRRFAQLLGDALALAHEQAAAPDAATAFANEYGLSISEVEQWISTTRWARSVGVERDMLRSVADTLATLGLVEQAVDVDSLTHGAEDP